MHGTTNIKLEFTFPASLLLDSTYIFMGLTMTSVSKAIPVGAWTGPEGSRSLTPPDFKKIGT